MTDDKTASTTATAKSDAAWRAVLTPEQYKVLRQKGTERAFTGGLWDEHRPGAYRCAGCNTELFRSDAKFDSGTGWPSFSAPADPAVVATKTDRSLFMTRTEAVCATCGGHLGHVFKEAQTRRAFATASIRRRWSSIRRIDRPRRAHVRHALIASGAVAGDQGRVPVDHW